MAQYLFLAEFLKRKREEAGWTQLQLARQLERMDPRIVGNWERGYHVPPVYCFPRLIQLLSIDKKELVKVLAADTRAGLEKSNFQTHPKPHQISGF